ncbi:hypothetical protein D3C77_688370 [compost metagenome]
MFWLTPFPFKNVQEQIGTALPPAHDGHAFSGKIRLAQHHFAGVEALIILLRHAVRQFDLLANPHAQVFGVEHIILGGDDKVSLLVIKRHMLDFLVECQ